MDREEQTAWDSITEYDERAGNPPVYDLPDSEIARLAEAVQPVIDKWAKEADAKGLQGTAIVEDMLASIEKYSE